LGLLNFIKKRNSNQELFRLHLKLANVWGKQWDLIHRSIDVQLKHEFDKRYETKNKKLETPVKISVPHMISILNSMFQIISLKMTPRGPKHVAG
jgi:hypothetical protein